MYIVGAHIDAFKEQPNKYYHWQIMTFMSWKRENYLELGTYEKAFKITLKFQFIANTTQSHIVMMYKTMNLIHEEIYGQPIAILVLFALMCSQGSDKPQRPLVLTAAFSADIQFFHH